MDNFSLSSLIPTPPNEGPPLPEFLKIYWPWYKAAPPAATTFTITASVSGSGGTVSPSTVTVISGNDDSITILPGSGYQIDTITDNGAAVSNPTSPYVITNVTADHAIVVTFAASSAPSPPTGPTTPPAATYTVTAAVSGGNGTVSPATQVENSGGSASITILPASGYEINTITDNGVAVTIANPYVINNVVANHAVVVTFAKSALALSGLTITASSGTTQVAVGDGLQFAASVKQSDGTVVDVTNAALIVWKSSNPAVATINNRGSLAAVAVGTTVISATYNDGVNNLTSNQITITVAAKVVAPTSGSVYGTVIDAGTGAPIAGVTITTFGVTATTDSNGNYTLTLPGGGYGVTFTKAGYATTVQTASVVAGYPYQLNVSLTTTAAAVHPSVTVSPSSVALGSQTALTFTMKGFQYDPTGVMNTTHTVTYEGVTWQEPDHYFPKDNYLAIYIDGIELGQVAMNPDGSGTLIYNMGNWEFLTTYTFMAVDVFGNSASCTMTVTGSYGS